MSAHWFSDRTLVASRTDAVRVFVRCMRVDLVLALAVELREVIQVDYLTAHSTETNYLDWEPYVALCVHEPSLVG